MIWIDLVLICGSIRIKFSSADLNLNQMVSTIVLNRRYGIDTVSIRYQKVDTVLAICTLENTHPSRRPTSKSTTNTINSISPHNAWLVYADIASDYTSIINVYIFGQTVSNGIYRLIKSYIRYQIIYTVFLCTKKRIIPNYLHKNTVSLNVSK